MSIATQENCPECGSQLVLAEGGGYWDCSHPQCQGHLTFKTEKIIRKLREERADFRDKRLIMHGRLEEALSRAKHAEDKAIARTPGPGESRDAIGPMPKRLGSCIKEYFEADFNRKGRRLGKA
jgi:ssDNA-binding Zn-finger/Zn-ribbon topoisomerase 1